MNVMCDLEPFSEIRSHMLYTLLQIHLCKHVRIYVHMHTITLAAYYELKIIVHKLLFIS